MLPMAFLFLFLGRIEGHAQTLNFSNVLLQAKGTTDTVPANKVWKIVGYTAESEIVGGTSAKPMTVNINGVINFLSFSAKDGNGVSYETGGSRGPLWLPSGTVLEVINSGGGIQNVSIIEFTVVP